MNTTEQAPVITQLEFDESDFPIAEKIAKRLGFIQTAYTSTSALWGLFCLPENPANVTGMACGKCQDRPGFNGLGRPCKHCHGTGWLRPPMPEGTPTKGGCIIKTQQFGFMFVADLEDMHMEDLRP